MAEEGIPFQGVLYAGLMITRSGPQVLEFNTRFGDPEAQVVLPRLDNDLYVVLDAAIDGELGSLKPLAWSRDAACGVVVASQGYPGDVETGYGVVGLGETGSTSWVFHNGTKSPFMKAQVAVTPKVVRPARGAFGGRSFFGMLLPGRGLGRDVDRQAAMALRGRENQVITSGGRVLTVVARARTLEEARTSAYRLCESVTFTGCWSRTDIAADDATLGT
jgi:phosphoribosylamine-glycine ligase